jgi:hypothetical protein
VASIAHLLIGQKIQLVRDFFVHDISIRKLARKYEISEMQAQECLRFYTFAFCEEEDHRFKLNPQPKGEGE